MKTQKTKDKEVSGVSKKEEIKLTLFIGIVSLGVIGIIVGIIIGISAIFS